MSEYDEQAEKFLKDTKTEFKAVFFKNGRYFPDDDEPRDIYKITLKRGERVYIFNFGQSIVCSGKYKHYSKDGIKKVQKATYPMGDFAKNKDFTEPTAYDVLSCLTKYNPDTFGEFCDSFGYDSDSRKAERTYKAVVEEWKQIKILWNDEEIEQLQEIN